MSDLLTAGRALALDLASTLLFMLILALGGSLTLAVTSGLALAAAQIGWELRRGRRIDALQWTSLAIVAISGGAALLTHDPRIVMVKPTLLYSLAGAAMLQRGWMLRYMGEDAMTWVPDMAIGFGYVWAGLMFFSAALNLGLALTMRPTAWAATMSIWGLASKPALCVLQITLMKSIGRRRYRAQHRTAALKAA